MKWNKLSLTLAICLCAGANLIVSPAAAQSFRLNVEGDAAFSLNKLEPSRATPSPYLAIRPGIALGSMATLQLSYAFLNAPVPENFSDVKRAHFFTAGIRVRPFALIENFDALDGLFADLNVGFVRASDLNRFGLDIGLGYNFDITRWLALGPVVRYIQVQHPHHTPSIYDVDARFFSVGLNVEFGVPQAYEADHDHD